MSKSFNICCEVSGAGLGHFFFVEGLFLFVILISGGKNVSETIFYIEEVKTNRANINIRLATESWRAIFYKTVCFSLAGVKINSRIFIQNCWQIKEDADKTGRQCSQQIIMSLLNFLNIVNKLIYCQYDHFNF